MKSKIVIVVVLILLAAGALFYLKQNKSASEQNSNNGSKKSDVIEQAKTMPIQAYSINGKITKVEPDKITFDSVIIKNGSQLTVSKTAVTTKDTALLDVSNKTITLTSFKVGQSITVYTSVYPYDQNTVTATKIQISK